jgi:lipoprotein-anchoring transpeptidase ErfK/SrfK
LAGEYAAPGFFHIRWFAAMHRSLIAFLGLAMIGLNGPAHAEGLLFHWNQPSAATPTAHDQVETPSHISRRQATRVESAAKPQPARGSGLLGIFGAQPAPEPVFSEDTQEKDAILAERTAKRPFHVKPAFQPQSVRFTGYAAGTIVIDTHARFLYLVESPFSARRYPIAVGREGMLFTGEATIGDMQEWPKWFPTKDMIKNEAKKYARYKDGMDGGVSNPLGARAIYLYQGKRDTYIRIHGTNEPSSIGSAASHGCFRMYNAQVMDLYNRVKLGAKVVVI